MLSSDYSRPFGAAMAWAVLVLAVSSWAGDIAGEAPLRAMLVPEGQGDRLLVEALCDSGAQGRVSYELRVRKSGPSGTADSRQSGAAFVEPGRSRLAGLRLSVASGDRLEVTLRLVMDGQEAQARLAYP